ncbi:MAG: SDR family oxidoreductase, partial [Acidimicrobiales bacterium]
MSTVLVTGASGYVGGLVARRYQEQGDEVLVHGRQGGDASIEGLHAVVGDLADAEPFAALGGDWLGRITAIVHAGAITRFDVDEERARAVNVDGTAKVLAFARRCPRLESLGLVSTVYATGLRAGRVVEDLYDDEAGFANAYEWSKWRAERLVAELGDELPWRILRVATVIADDESGRVTQHNAFHETLKLWFHGLLPLVPGHPDTPLYLVTGDFVADAIVVLMSPEGGGGVFHLAHEPAHSLTLGEAVEVVSGAFEAVDGFRRRRVLRPLLGD